MNFFLENLSVFSGVLGYVLACILLRVCPILIFFFLCVWFWGGGRGNNVGTRKKGEDQPKKRGGLVPLFPTPLDPPISIIIVITCFVWALVLI